MRRVLLAALVAAVALAACGGGETQVQPTTIPISAECREAFAALAPEDAGDADEDTDQDTDQEGGDPALPGPTIAPGSVADLIPTVQACDSVDEWIEAYRSNPADIQLRAFEPIAVLRSLCLHARSAGIEDARLCEGVAVEPETEVSG